MAVKSTYPWSKWFYKKRPFVISACDYTASQKSMAVMIRQTARLYGVVVGVFKLENGDIRIEPRGQRPTGSRV